METQHEMYIVMEQFENIHVEEHDVEEVEEIQGSAPAKEGKKNPRLRRSSNMDTLKEGVVGHANE